jgi:hypothetical protein
MSNRLRSCLLVSLLLPACGSEGGASDAAIPPDAPAGADAGLHPEAIPIVDGMAEGTIAEPGESVWFEETSDGGEWIVVELELHDPQLFPIVKVALYDAADTILATNQQGYADLGRPGKVRAYLEEAGTYYLVVTDDAPPSGTEPWTPVSFTVVVRAPMAPSEYLDPETGDSLGDALAVPDTGGFLATDAFLIGRHEHAADADAFVLPVADQRRLNVFLADGSVRRMAAYDPAGALYARVDRDLYPLGRIDPPMHAGAGDWSIVLAGASATAGGWYVAWVAANAPPDYPFDGTTTEAEDPGAPGTNDSAGTAEALPLYTYSDADRYGLAGLPVGRLSDASDVDVFAFQIDDPADLFLACWAGFIGSGARLLQIDFLDSAGTLINTSHELGDDARIDWTPTVAGSYSLAVRKFDQDPEVASDYYKCAVLVMPP